MRPAVLLLAPARAVALGLVLALTAQAQTPLPTPGFHHVHLNSTNPSAAIDFYAAQFPSTRRVTFAGLPALKAGSLFLLFNRVKTPPPTTPQTAIWHFGWYVTDVHKNLDMYRQRPGVRVVPLYVAGEGGAIVKTDIAEVKAQGDQPAEGNGFVFIAGPEGGVIETQGNMTAERFSHLHMFQQDPYCAELWYHRHLNAPSKLTQTEADCKAPRPGRSWPSFEPEGMFRQPAGATFDDVSVTWHVQQNETPLAPTRGSLVDHFALSVGNLDAWIAKLRGEGVKFLTKPYNLGALRAVMIEGPSREAIELVETVKPNSSQ